MSVLPNNKLSEQVPEYATLSFFEKRTKYAIVIPTINEGARILDQLQRMKMLGISDLADIFLVDGGSTDGSTEADRLQELAVRGILTKIGRGKLSAQLRVGYWHILTEGYDGVITIDGNGKDSVESVPLFLKALDEGIDYAQASRFVAGGGAINTPRIRDLAIRAIHSPVLSLAARRRFTDTTQGFRAYSRRYLTDPRVQPFRDIFQTYELLAYLTVRASQIGFKTREVPTTRSYPSSGKIPTKLTWRGNVKLLQILWNTLSGKYHPER